MCVNGCPPICFGAHCRIRDIFPEAGSAAFLPSRHCMCTKIVRNAESNRMNDIGGAQGMRLRDRVYKAPSPIHGTGCFARISFEPGDFIGTYEGPRAKRDGTYVLWVLAEGEEPIGRSGRNLLRYLNHQEDGNAEFDGFDLYARRAIASGEEITFDYNGAVLEAQEE